jgi:hypothetical protein
MNARGHWYSQSHGITDALSQKTKMINRTHVRMPSRTEYLVPFRNT